MEIAGIVMTILGIVGGGITILNFLRNRDKDKSEEVTKSKDESNKINTKITELEVRLEVYKEELDNLKRSVNTIETKMVDKMDALNFKLDTLNEKLIQLIAKQPNN